MVDKKEEFKKNYASNQRDIVVININSVIRVKWFCKITWRFLYSNFVKIIKFPVLSAI